jgi:hypothetical protein
MSKDAPKPVIEAGSDCFVIMPIADPEGYDAGHFKKVYEDIFRPACEKAGFIPCRADDITQTNLIHEDILRRLIDSPIAICDLSSRNPNVLFELGLRQAFDKPTVLVQEAGTPRIFDIAPLRYTEYRQSLRYREVLEDQKSIEIALSSTAEAARKGEGINSIVRILSLSAPAALAKVDDGDTAALLRLVRAEMSQMRSDLRRATYSNERNRKDEFSEPKIRDRKGIELMDLKRLFDEIDELKRRAAPVPLILSRMSNVQQSLAELIESDLPDGLRDECKMLYLRAESLERELASDRLRLSSKDKRLGMTSN